MLVPVFRLVLAIGIIDTVYGSCSEEILPELNAYQDKLSEKCSADPTPVIVAPRLLPVFDYFIQNLIKKTPKALIGKLPDGSADVLLKTRGVFESLTDADMCAETGIDKVRESVMPHLSDYIFPMKFSFDRNCPVYRDWLKGEEGQAFLTGLNEVVDKVLP